MENLTTELNGVKSLRYKEIKHGVSLRYMGFGKISFTDFSYFSYSSPKILRSIIVSP